jgi:hypothetical protein
MPAEPRGEESAHPNERERFAMNVKTASPASAAHGAGATHAASGPAKGAKPAAAGNADFSKMLKNAQADGPAAAAHATPPAAPAATTPAPATLAVDTASLAARA